MTTSSRSAAATTAAARTAPTTRAADHIAWRDLVALAVPVTATLEPFLARKGAPPDAVRRMQQAWVKAVLLQTILWSHPYVRDGDF